MQKEEIIWVDINSIKPFEGNPRAIAKENFETLRAGIKEFGLKAQPLVINKITGNLISGHQRLKAAIAEGHIKVPVIYIDLEDAKERALNIVLNNRKAQGFFTDDLDSMIDELKGDLPPELFESLKLGDLASELSWAPDGAAMDSIPESDALPNATIKITCPMLIKDEVLFYLKEKFLESSFEGIHIE